MNDFFPIPGVTLPTRISPCPIVDAALEIRFVTSQSWSVLAGLFFALVRERYTSQVDLPLQQLPEEVRRQDSSLTYLPLVQFYSDSFLIQLGPRVVSLNALPRRYPGWTAVASEISWLLKTIEHGGLIKEAERLGTRYIDFFADDIFPHLILRSQIADTPFQPRELMLTTVLRRTPFTARLLIANNAVVGQQADAKTGSILEVDVWVGALDFDLFKNGRDRFAEAHAIVKQTFFGLLTPEFLASLHPEYP